MNILFWLLIWFIIAVSGGLLLSVFLKKSKYKETEIYEAKHTAEYILGNKGKRAMMILDALRKNGFSQKNITIEEREMMYILDNLERSILDVKANKSATASFPNLRAKAEEDVVIGFIVPQPKEST